MSSCVPQQFQYSPLSSTSAPLESPRLSNNASTSSSASPSPLYFIEDGRQYAIAEENPNVYMYGVAPPSASNSHSHTRTLSDCQQPSMIPQQVQMQEYMPMDYSLAHPLYQSQQPPTLQHRYQDSSSSSSSVSTLNTAMQLSHPSGSPMNSIAISPLEMVSPRAASASDGINGGVAYVSFDETQHHSQPQLDYMGKHSTAGFPPTPAMPPTPRYSFSVADLPLASSPPTVIATQNAEHKQQDAHKPRTRNKSSSSVTESNNMQGPKIQQDKTSSASNTQQRPHTTSIPSSTVTTGAPPKRKSAPVKRKRAARRRLTENQKIAHNKIEKKYRTNINEKIFSLGDLIPLTFKCESECSSGEEGGNEEEGYNENEVRNESGRPNKSKILERAASYIKYLKNNNSKLREQNQDLSNARKSAGTLNRRFSSM